MTDEIEIDTDDHRSGVKPDDELLLAIAARIGPDRPGQAAGARLEVVTGEMSATVDAVLDRAAQAVEQSRQGITAQGDAMLAMLATNQAALNSAGDEGAAAGGSADCPADFGASDL